MSNSSLLCSVLVDAHVFGTRRTARACPVAPRRWACPTSTAGLRLPGFTDPRTGNLTEVQGSRRRTDSRHPRTTVATPHHLHHHPASAVAHLGQSCRGSAVQQPLPLLHSTAKEREKKVVAGSRWSGGGARASGAAAACRDRAERRRHRAREREQPGASSPSGRGLMR